MQHIKLIALYIFYTSFAIATSQEPILPMFFTTQTNDTSTAYGHYIPCPNLHITQSHQWDYFYASCFTVPYMLEKAKTEQCPFILVIPEKYNGYTPVCPEASLIEGARVALTWTSVYFRFCELGNVDIRVLLVPPQMAQNKNFVQNAISHLLKKTIQKDIHTTLEERMTNRIVPARFYKNTDNNYTVKINPYHPPIVTEKQISLTTKLTPTPNKKRIVITGAAGFLGSHLTQALLEKNYQIIGIDNLSCCTGENIKDFANNPDFEFHQFDVSYPFDIDCPIDTVIHLASVPSPAQYYAKPVETLRSGLHGTLQTIELARKKGARFVFSSSSEVYGNPKINPQTEQYPGIVSPIGKRSQYDESKRGAETLLKHYFERYNLDIRIARIFNTFGPGMQLSDGRVITNFIQAALNNKPMLIHGDGTQTRSPTYVSDMIDGLIKIIESEKINNFKTIKQRIFNIGNPEEYSVNEIASCVNQLSQKHLGVKTAIKHIDQFDTTDPKVRRPDISYINKVTGFEPRVSFEEGLEKTFLHYLQEKNYEI